MFAMLSQGAQASQMLVTSAETPQSPAIIVINGPLLPNEGEQFKSLIAFISKAVVVFQSDGGNLQAGIEIGRAIRLKGFATFVPDGIRCASACATAWLGGLPRFVGPRAYIGFHAAYSGLTGAESGAGNALLGAYLNQIGLPEVAIYYITQSAPQSMTWLTLNDAARYGIDVKPLDMSSQQPVRQAPPALLSQQPQATRSPVTATLEGKTRNFVANIFANWPGAIEDNYPEQLSYYGKTATREEVMTEKRKFMARWPTRKYVPTDMAVNCVEERDTCYVEVNADWEVSNQTGSRRGKMHLTYKIDWFEKQDPSIVEEKSETWRQVTPQPSEWLSSWMKGAFGK
jgi:hypothetical protein